MPRSTPAAANERALIAKLRAKVARLEAKLSQIENSSPPPHDMSGWTLDERLEGYSPSREEFEQMAEEARERLTVWGRNLGVLSEEKVRELSDNEQLSILTTIK